ncbi:MAG: hypothetical protein AUG49_23135 [Catenulispora sp. 13_1_20CM_3_70_7]|jgi:hypothetical protein|nr:MAG: hypothetical protein AUG49_23135 [Catenulispora sp. 13_1_20CM_3_70_7]
MAAETEYDELADAAGSTRTETLTQASIDAVPAAADTTAGLRTRDLEEFRAASAAADGDPIEEVDACTVRGDMTIWFPEPAPGRWRPVKDADVAGPKTVIEFIAPPPYSSSWTLTSDRPVCRRITSREVRSVPAD